MDVLYGPTDMSARTRSVEGDTTGGHTGPPLRDHRSAQPPQRGGTEPAPYRCATGSAQQRADVPRAWLPPAKFRNGIWGVSHRHRPLRPAGDEGRHAGSSCPTGGCGEPPRLPWVAAHSGASAAQTGGTGGNRGRDHPKSVQQRRTLPQSAFGRQLPLHKGALGAGGTDCHVGPAGLLAMTMVFCHSEERADVGIRPFYDGREFGPPRSSAPTENPINHPSQPARSEASAPAAARDGRESTQGSSQKGDRRRDCPGSA